MHSFFELCKDFFKDMFTQNKIFDIQCKILRGNKTKQLTMHVNIRILRDFIQVIGFGNE